MWIHCWQGERIGWLPPSVNQCRVGALSFTHFFELPLI